MVESPFSSLLVFQYHSLTLYHESYSKLDHILPFVLKRTLLRLLLLGFYLASIWLLLGFYDLMGEMSLLTRKRQGWEGMDDGFPNKRGKSCDMDGDTDVDTGVDTETEVDARIKTKVKVNAKAKTKTKTKVNARTKAKAKARAKAKAKTKPKTKAPKKTTFLTLPREIRQQILSDAFEEARRQDWALMINLTTITKICTRQVTATITAPHIAALAARLRLVHRTVGVDMGFVLEMSLQRMEGFYDGDGEGEGCSGDAWVEKVGRWGELARDPDFEYGDGDEGIESEELTRFDFEVVRVIYPGVDVWDDDDSDEDCDGSVLLMDDSEDEDEFEDDGE